MLRVKFSIIYIILFYLLLILYYNIYLCEVVISFKKYFILYSYNYSFRILRLILFTYINLSYLNLKSETLKHYNVFRFYAYNILLYTKTLYPMVKELNFLVSSGILLNDNALEFYYVKKINHNCYTLPSET